MSGKNEEWVRIVNLVKERGKKKKPSQDWLIDRDMVEVLVIFFRVYEK